MSAARQDSTRYPESRMPVAGRLVSVSETVSPKTQRFLAMREDLLVDYGYRTARAYWADLQHIFEWTSEHDKNILYLTNDEFAQYEARLRRGLYSENTVRRRRTVWRLFSRKVASLD